MGFDLLVEGLKSPHWANVVVVGFIVIELGVERAVGLWSIGEVLNPSVARTAL